MRKTGRRAGSSPPTIRQMQITAAVPPAVREPVLQFNATQPLNGGGRREFTDVDNPALTAFVTALCDELYSREVHPMPPCPHCDHTRTRLHALLYTSERLAACEGTLSGEVACLHPPAPASHRRHGRGRLKPARDDCVHHDSRDLTSCAAVIRGIAYE